MRQYLNWKTYLVAVALIIVAASLFYTSQLTGKLADEEKKKVEQLAGAIKTLSTSNNIQETAFASNLLAQNTSIPLIITTTDGKTVDYKNIDSEYSVNYTDLIATKLIEYKKIHPVITVEWGTGKNFIYYGESSLLRQLRYFPYVQLTIILVFLIIVLITISTAHRSIQNQVWVGLSKETAHQLGTPLSSIEAWLELLRDKEENIDAVIEMQKDLDRLKLVAERFSKVGSTPKLEDENLLVRLKDIVAYMQLRSPKKVKINLIYTEDEIPINISGPLFDWVMENLIRNALDAMAGQGTIDITVINQPHQVVIDVQDNGKGIPSYQIKKVFAPGFTTKKRGWGLGLSLSKRIIEKYHHGSIYVKQSEMGKGTTFRIILKR